MVWWNFRKFPIFIFMEDCFLMSSREDVFKVFFWRKLATSKTWFSKTNLCLKNLFYHNVSKKLYWKKDVLRKCVFVVPNLEDNTYLQSRPGLKSGKNISTGVLQPIGDFATQPTPPLSTPPGIELINHWFSPSKALIKPFISECGG